MDLWTLSFYLVINSAVSMIVHGALPSRFDILQVTVYGLLILCCISAALSPCQTHTFLDSQPGKIIANPTLYFQGDCCATIVLYFLHFWHQLQSWAGFKRKIKCEIMKHLPPVTLVTALRRGQWVSSVTLVPLKTPVMFTAGLGMMSVSFLKLDLVKRSNSVNAGITF